MIARGVTTHEEARELLEAAALGALEKSEQTALMAHVNTCPDCRAELTSLRDTAGLLARAAEGASLPDARSDAIRARLLDRARRNKQASPSFGSRGVAIAAGILLVVAL